MRNLVNLVATAGVMVMAATPVLAVGGMAHAQEAGAVRVSFSDLDLARPEARAVFDRRVAAASDAVCRPTGPAELARTAACQRFVRDQAAAQLHELRPAAGRAPVWTVAGR